MDRRVFLTGSAASLITAVMASACSTGPSGGSRADSAGTRDSTASVDAFPVTISHHFGETTIERQPTRVATLGANDPDNVLALGVVPIGVTKNSYGGNARGSTPWFEAKLAEMGADLPTLYDNSDSVPIDDIAALGPDLILATNYSLTRSQYDKLSKIAPVVAYPGEPWVTTWQETVSLCGEALGRSATAAAVIAETESTLKAARTRFPHIQGKTFIFAALSTSDLSSISYYTVQDQRPELLVSLGMENAPVIEQIGTDGQFYGTISAERAPDLIADVFITYGETAADRAAFSQDKLVGQVPAIEAGHLLVVTDTTLGLAVSVPSPLSIPYTMKHFVPSLDQTATGA